MKNFPKLTVLLFMLFSNLNSIAQWINKETVLATVLIERVTGGEFTPLGTGFLIRNLRIQDS